MDMAFHILDDILVFAFGGLYRRGDENEIIEQFFAALRTHDIRKILIDCRGLDGRMSIADTFFLAQNISPDHHLKTAIVEREEYRNSADFQNLVFHNAGHSNLYLF